MGFLHPMNWVGWTAALLVVALVVGAALLDGMHKGIKGMLWVAGATVAVIAAYNALKGR